MVAREECLYVFMNGLLLGILTKAKQGYLSFSYDSNWLDMPGARPISLSLPLQEKAYTGERVFNFFENLLPDNPKIREKIQARFKVSTNQPFDLLAAIGRDCIGAIQLLPSLKLFEKKISAEPLTEQEIAEILRSTKVHPLGMQQSIDDFRISLAGAQEKTAFLFHENQWCIPLGETPTSHIFKLPIGQIAHQGLDLSESCENEWLCLALARAFGLPVANAKIASFDGEKVLIVERFDRKLAKDKSWLMRLPQEDMCQALGISSQLKYQADGGPGIAAIMNLLLSAKNSQEDRALFMRAQLFFYLIAGIDGHAKNFSVFLQPEGKFSLTPLYDIISAFPLIQQKSLNIRKIKMAMAWRGNNNHYHWHKIQKRHFFSSAKAAKYSERLTEDMLNDLLVKTDGVIECVANALPKGFPSHIADPIFEGLLKTKNKLVMSV